MHVKQWGMRLARVILVLLSVMCGTIHDAAADGLGEIAPDDRTIDFDIAPQPLSSALHVFAGTTGWEVSSVADVTEGRTSPGIQGTLTPEAGLKALLAGTGLTYRRIGSQTVTIERDTSSGILPNVVGAGTAGVVAGEIGAANGSEAPRRAQKLVKVPEIVVKDVKERDTAMIGDSPPDYAGGQVAEGGRVGMLGNRNYMETPFSTTNYTNKFIRDRQARTLADVLLDDPSIRTATAHNTFTDTISIRGFSLDNEAGNTSINGLAGLLPRRIQLEGIERVEVLRGPNAMLSGALLGGNIAGTVNYTTKRATDDPITRIIGTYASDTTLGGHIDLGRRYGEHKQWGVRFNGAYRDGSTSLEGQSERIGNVTLGVDYRGDRFRVTVDMGHSSLYLRQYSQGVSLGAGAILPSPPSATTTLSPSWQRVPVEQTYGLARVEYDILSTTTIGAGYGHSYHTERSFQTILTNLRSDGTLTTSPGFFPYALHTDSADAYVRSRVHTGPIKHDLSAMANLVHRSSAFSFFFPVPGSFSSIQNIYSPFNVPEPNKTPLSTSPAKTNDTLLSSIAIGDVLSAFDDRVQLTIGGRLQQLELEAYDPQTGTRLSRYDKQALTPALGVLVRPIKPLTLYANYIEALTTGPSAPVGAANFTQIFEPTVSRQYEIGSKVDLNGLGIQFALFQITRPNGILNASTNIFTVDGRQRNRGAELLVFGEPIPGFRLLGGGSYMEAVLTRTANGATDGNQAVAVPHYLFNFGPELDISFVPGLSIWGRLVYTGRAYLNAANTQTIPDWTRVDLGARYSFIWNHTPLVARLSVENVTGANYWQAAASSQLSLGLPRTVLLSLQADF